MSSLGPDKKIGPILPSPIQRLAGFGENYCKVRIKRDDLIHPLASGNKWRKLKHNLNKAESQGAKTIVTMGGAFSNHLYALASIGNHYNFKTEGWIKGEYVDTDNPTLSYVRDQNMNLTLFEGEEYKSLRWDGPKRKKLLKKYKNPYFVPEGGSNIEGILGASELIPEISSQLDPFPTHICLSVGTGGTICGVISASKSNTKILGFSAFKKDIHSMEIKANLTALEKEDPKNWQILNPKHFNGFGSFNTDLVNFINDFYEQYSIPLDPVYNGKMMFSLKKMIKQKYFPEGSNILVIHTGGLQGIDGFNMRYGKKYGEIG